MRNRIASTFSLLLFAATFAVATDYAGLQRALQHASTKSERARVIRQIEAASQTDPQLEQAAKSVEAANYESQRMHHLAQMLDARDDAQTATGLVPSAHQLAAKATSIKQNPLYRDSGPVQSSNWLEKALEALQSKKQNDTPQEYEAPKIGSSGIGNFFLFGVIGLLAAAIIAFIVVVVRHVDWKKAQKRKASAMLEEDEPSRTADEWLDLADKLTAQGRFREAVRCLYLACLLRFDESQVARFDRRQTNWEHLARIQASLRRPEEIDFLPPTKLFDRIWYGHRIRGVQDVEQFRTWYSDIVEALRTARAA